MTATTIRIEETLEARIAAAAERVGKSPHAFILDALAESVDRIEMEEEVHRIADKRWSALVRTGESVSWNEAKAYVQARAAGKKPRRPTARKPTR